ncbi:hypothetical protein [Occultella kanbiaonis]|uniref:hypothetical protein n=1 Tax=Occultella kanbiaonis TaxID=2675754 RepID=UPI0012B771EC|nr:hypothetical protein [Occultella kanbiaonis]
MLDVGSVRAALAGLLIVAISVNVKDILASKVATRGASATIGAMVLALVACLVLLIPEQSTTAVGVELWIALVPPLVLQVASIVTALREARRRGSGVAPWVLVAVGGLAVAQFAPFLVGAGLLVTGRAAGLLGIAAGVVLVVVASMVAAWAMLVEVLR